MEATRAIMWMRQLRTSGGSSVPDACVFQPILTSLQQDSLQTCFVKSYEDDERKDRVDSRTNLNSVDFQPSEPRTQRTR